MKLYLITENNTKYSMIICAKEILEVREIYLKHRGENEFEIHYLGTAFHKIKKGVVYEFI